MLGMESLFGTTFARREAATSFIIGFSQLTVVASHRLC